jgi:hypothetical protein
MTELPSYRELPEAPRGGRSAWGLGELWWLADLAADCAADGAYESFLVSSPLNAPGGIGSPASATAIK